MTPVQKSLGLLIYDVGAFKDKTKSPEGDGFLLKLHEKNPNAPKSPYYIMLRTSDNPKPGPLTPSVVEAIGRLLFEYAESLGLKYDCVAGIPNAGYPIAEAFFFAIPPERKVKLLKLGKVKEGGNRKIEGVIGGEYKQGDRVLLIDDLVTMADTKKEAAEEVEKKGMKVACILVLIDREQGGAAEIAKAGYNLCSAFKVSELLELYLASGRISKDVYDEIEEYRANN